MSVVSVPSANATFGTGGYASTLYVATTASTTGSAALAGSGAISSTSNVSVGWITDTSATAATTVSNGVLIQNSEAKTATVFAGAKLAFSAQSGGTTSAVSVVVTGGTLSSVTGIDDTSASSTGLSLNGSATVARYYPASGDNQLQGHFLITAAAGQTATLSAYTGLNTEMSSTSTATAGVLIGTWTFTVAAASASGVYSAGDSTITQQACIAASGTTGGTNSYDTTSACRNGQVAVIYFNLVDAYSSALNSGNVYATASGGARVNVVGSGGVGDAYSATAAFDNLASDGSGYVVVTQPVSGVAGNSDVTISYNGTVVATKNVKWFGDAASITVAPSSKKHFPNNLTDSNLTGARAGVIYVIKDAAGNSIAFDSQPTVDSATGAMVGATLSTSTNALVAAVQTASAGYGYSTMNLPGNALSGAGTYRLKITNSAGTALYSAVQNVTVSRGDTDSFAVSWDKTTYAPGEIATLTITVKDAYGNLQASGTTLAGLDLTVSTAGFTAVGTACTTSSTADAGVTTCKYAAGNTEGQYSYSVDLTTVTAQAASVGTLAIKNSTASVTNAEVLAAIVKLIASINKQIRALQRSLR